MEKEIGEICSKLSLGDDDESDEEVFIDDRLMVEGKGFGDLCLIGKMPWSFNKALVIFSNYDESENIEDVMIEWCPFWLQLHGIPFCLMTEKVARTIAVSAGPVGEVDSSKGLGVGKDKCENPAKFIEAFEQGLLDDTVE
ncbi:hypothetical protein PTKIN_Ptkin08bG0140700 [Pterospermum kingtungense]